MGPCAALLERVGGDAEIFSELCEAFLEDAPKRLALMRGALASQDATTLQREAHAFKGAAAAFDAEEVMFAARCLEQLAAAGKLAEARQVFAVVESRGRVLIEAVRVGKEHG